METFLIWFFGAVCGMTAGFVTAGLMHVASVADDEAETLEQILRREP